ncbi:PPOX class probable F420-dependent enzyme [Motilibacter peucedani]|uniref:PPOX class probable F420-dependent enzyme n=1 Tax=Motilibacter peucedani TaxID=598650 RepID=A0A420XRD7_9ACTN|nr:PPOX class F420-dependent oxidoreductase [Motilibacter peucedani]RKS77367.1 PPOX class probable F420-dependent enzyme [Motilibacter peucedani]
MRLLERSALEFVAERHLATLTTMRADGTPHVVPVGFTVSGGVARVITSGTSTKARNAARGGRAVLCSVDGARWLTLEGTVRVLRDPESVAAAVAAYGQRYRQPRENPERVVVEIAVDRVLGSPGLTAARPAPDAPPGAAGAPAAPGPES